MKTKTTSNVLGFQICFNVLWQSTPHTGCVFRPQGIVVIHGMVDAFMNTSLVDEETEKLRAAACSDAEDTIFKGKLLQLQLRLFRTCIKSRKPDERVPPLFTEFAETEQKNAVGFLPVDVRTLVEFRRWATEST